MLHSGEKPHFHRQTYTRMEYHIIKYDPFTNTNTHKSAHMNTYK